MTTALWLVAAASLLATWLNIHRRRACFAIWAATNAAWAWADYHAGLYAQAALQAVYFGLSIYGLERWRRDAVERARDHAPAAAHAPALAGAAAHAPSPAPAHPRPHAAGHASSHAHAATTPREAPS